MTVSMKRIICSVFVFCILVASLAACGGDKKGNTSSGSGSAGGTASTSSRIPGDDETVSATKPSNYDENYDPYANMPENLKGTTVRFATWGDPYASEDGVALTNMEADISIKPEILTTPQSGYVTHLMSLIAAGDIPDVVMSNEGTQCFPLTLQVLQPINKCSTIDLNDPIWDQSMLKTATIDGNVYMVNTIGSPWVGSNLIFFNKALFEENGFTTPEQYYADGNWTWSTLEKVLKDIKSLGDEYKPGRVDIEMLADSAGVSCCMYDFETATFRNGMNDPKLLAAYETYARWRDEGLTTGTEQDFIQGKCGIYTTGVWGLKKEGRWKDMDPNDIGYTYLPALAGGEKGLTSSIYRMYGVCANAPNPDAAGYFLRYYLDPDNYDLEDTFITNKAGNFYYELTNNPATNKYFNFDDGCANLIGQDQSWYFIGKAAMSAPAQVGAKLQAASNLVDQAVAAANQLIQTVRTTYK